MITVKKCPMCKSGNLVRLKTMKFFYPGDEVEDNLIDIRYVRLWILFEKILKDRSPVEFQVMLCQSCGFIFTNPRFTAKEIQVKYRTINELGSVKKRYQRYPPHRLDVRAKRIHSLITACLMETKDKPLRIVDYGGAWGYNLIPFAESGNQCYILDYEKWDLPSGIEYLGEDIRHITPDDLFDVVLCLHTLEHAIKPMNLLQELSAHLSDSGLLYIEVPLGSFHECTHLREPLTHVNFFSEESLYKGLHSVGLSIIHLSTAYQWVMNGNMWCINAVARKGGEDAITQYKSTRRQMRDIRYYWPLAVNKVFRTVRNLKGIISRDRI